ncbi:MAG TPA: cytochrome c biogenesis protein ResB [Candidatus Competibacteraceae bacterium]|nr:cytochrome c biogenesis protein ResB [Candidatus Competibacteraceae bacterium]
MNDTTDCKPLRQRTLRWVLLEFLGSMNLAITLLVVVAVASVIGTVLQQNQPYPGYILKFGPFWFEVFRQIGLYNVYGSGWFMSILAFLILSTSVCIYRQAPVLWREMTQFRTRVRLDSLRGFHQQAEWQLRHREASIVQKTLGEILKTRGYRWHIEDHGDHRVIAATKGRFSRLGYLCTHAAVVIIGIGGLLDGNLWLKFKEWSGDLRIETRDLAARDLPPESRLAPGAVPAFRGNVMLPEGATANFVFLRVRDGFVLQELPFAIELKDFQVAYYDTGQPKSFASEVLIHDQEHLGSQPLAATIRVNHPLVYRGYAIYQSDFGDGGSKLEMQVWPLIAPRTQPVAARGEIGNALKIGGPSAPLTLELNEFRLFNLLPEPSAQPGDRKFRNFGPSFSFKLRNPAGEAQEYFNYMAPAQLEGRWFYISGKRTQPAGPFTYLHIPADTQNSPERFLRFNARLRDREWLREWMERSPAPGNNPDFQHDFNQVRLNLIELFTQGGFIAVTEQAKAVVPAGRLKEATTLYLNILRDTLADVFIQVLHDEGMNVEQGISDQEEAFFNDAISALAALADYGSPFYLQLTGFQQVEASGLQVTRSGGTAVVYTGFALLIIGIFVMLYTSHRRLWIWLADEEGATRLVLAGVSSRRLVEFAGEFSELRTALEKQIND